MVTPGKDIDQEKAREHPDTNQRVYRYDHVYYSIDERDLLFRAWMYTGIRVKLSGLVTDIAHLGDGSKLEQDLLLRRRPDDKTAVWMTLRIGSFPHWVTVIVRYPQSLPELQKGMRATVYGLCARTERIRYESDDFIGLTPRQPLIRAEYVELEGV